MEWYDSFYLKSNFDKTKLDKYKKFLLKEDENNKLELEYNKSIEHIEELTKKDNLEEHLNTFNSLSILEEEFQIIKLLSKYTLQNNYLNFDFFMKCINILLISTIILRDRLNLQKIVHKVKNYNNYIPRCSYKFCNFKNDCFYNYSQKTTNVCYQDHYVHNMVEADLIILKDYISLKFNENNLVVPNKEILKTINTLSFVIEHMYSELKSRCLYMNEDEIEAEHFIKKNITNVK
tara:strand:- start:1288 stop:1989 length:702 start_codon:yes stop_codon:yes gene_type:complete